MVHFTTSSSPQPQSFPFPQLLPLPTTSPPSSKIWRRASSISSGEADSEQGADLVTPFARLPQAWCVHHLVFHDFFPLTSSRSGGEQRADMEQGADPVTPFAGVDDSDMMLRLENLAHLATSLMYSEEI
nr:hypothetical protein Iba_chr07eCG6100 [Ipomoea batatas]